MQTAAFLRPRPKCRSPPNPIGFRASPKKLIGVRKMKNWKKLRNYRKIENPDGSFTYIITVYGQDIEVREEIYMPYASIGNKMEYMEYDLKHDRALQDAAGKVVLDSNGLAVKLPEREISLEKLMDEDWDFESAEPPLDVAVVASLEIDALYRCLDVLDVGERALIQALFFDGMTERAYSAETGILQQTIHARKQVILAKLKKFLEK